MDLTHLSSPKPDPIDKKKFYADASCAGRCITPNVGENVDRLFDVYIGQALLVEIRGAYAVTPQGFE